MNYQKKHPSSYNKHANYYRQQRPIRPFSRTASAIDAATSSIDNTLDQDTTSSPSTNEMTMTTPNTTTTRTTLTEQEGPYSTANNNNNSNNTQSATTTTITTNDTTAIQRYCSKYPPTPTIRDCLTFTIPALGIYTCPPLMSLIDASFIGRSTVSSSSTSAMSSSSSSSIELAALGPASSISDSASLPLLFLSIAATNFVASSSSSSSSSQQQQQDDDTPMATTTTTTVVDVATATPDQARVTRVALSMGAIGGIMLAIALYVGAGPLSSLYCGASSAASATATATTKYCQSYVTIRALALPAVVITTIAQAVCIGTKDTSTPMVAVLVAGALNLIGDFILVKKRQLGIVGAAWATSFSQIVAGGLLLRVLQKRGFLRNPNNHSQSSSPSSTSLSSSSSSSTTTTTTTSPFNTTISTIRQLLSFVPFLFVMAVKIGWHNSCAATAASLGGAQAAAHSALVSVAMLCFVLGDVGSSMAQAFLPAFMTNTMQKQDKISTTLVASDKGIKNGNDDDNHDNVDNDIQAAATDATATTVSSSYFDLDAAMPTIKQLLRCTLAISTTVMIIASTIIGFFPTQITRDPAVVVEMKKALPWIVTALSFHGSAVTLEGLLLAQKKFRPLTICYSLLAVGVAAFQIATRRFGWGLAGVWGCYVWFCATRVVTFATLGGLLSFSKIGERIRQMAGRNDERQEE